MMDAEIKAEVFWDLCEPLINSGIAEKSTMMGFPCLRTDGKFFVSLERNTNNLIVKLPATRVTELIDTQQALPFAPNGRRFREWAVIDDVNQEQWKTLIEEALQFALES